MMDSSDKTRAIVLKAIRYGDNILIVNGFGMIQKPCQIVFVQFYQLTTALLKMSSHNLSQIVLKRSSCIAFKS